QPRVYYPGGVSRDRAQPMTLAAGDEQSAIDFTVVPSQPQLKRMGERPEPGEERDANALGAIRGRIDGADGHALARARVRLLSSGPPFGGRFAVTVANGQYEFSRVPAGSYKVQASKSGYLALQFGQRQPLASGETLWLDD